MYIKDHGRTKHHVYFYEWCGCANCEQSPQSPDCVGDYVMCDSEDVVVIDGLPQFTGDYEIRLVNP